MATAARTPWTWSNDVVGRSAEMARLEAGLLAAVGGETACVLLTGDPGIGKTRLAREIGEHADALGARCVWGRAWEAGGAPEYWPWTQILRVLLDEPALAATIAAEPAERRARLACVVPELAPGTAPEERGDVADDEGARFRLFDAVRAVIARATADRPLVLVVDDLHAADPSSILLVRFVLREQRRARLLVVGTYRTVEAERDPARAGVLAELAREGETLPLAPLAEGDVARLVADLLGERPPPAFVADVYRLSEGNPLLTGEAVRLLAARGPLDAAAPIDAVPARLPALVRGRLADLSPACRDALTVAAVIGREFDLADLRAATEVVPKVLLDLLGEAEVNGILRSASRGSGLYGFAHGLLREALYADAAPAHRAALHGRVADALERRHGGDPARIAELARHFAASAAAGADATKAVAYARRAGDEARRRCAYAEGAVHYERALDLLAAESTHDGARCDVTLLLGIAHTQAGDSRKARAAFRAAAALARRLDDPERLARAAVGIAGRGDVYTRLDREVVELLEEALGRLGDAPTALRARLLTRLARVLYYTGPRERVRAAAAEGLAIARATGQPSLLVNALDATHFALWEPGPTAPKLAVADELVACARAGGLREAEAGGQCWRFADLLEQGDLDGARAALAAYTELASELRQPFYLWRAAVHRAALALLQGRFDEGEQLVQEALVVGERLSSRTPMLIAGIHQYVLRREQGDFDTLEPMLRAMAEQNPTMPAFRAALAHLFAEAGRREDARAELDVVMGAGLAAFPRDANWLSTMGELAQVVAFLGDAERAAELYALLEPFAEQVMVTGVADLCEGAVARHLGMLARTLGRFDAAAAHFARALALDERLGAAPYVVRDRYELAGLHAARGAPGDAAEARRLVADAAAGAERLGMRGVAALAASLAVELAARRAEDHVFQRNDGAWMLRFAERAVRPKASRGLQYLALLLAEPGREWHALDLTAAVRGGAAADRRVHPRELADERLDVGGLGDAGVVLDARGKAEYRNRRAALRAEIAEAEATADSGRRERAERELDALDHALAAAYGLGGRAVRAGSAAERARVAVTKAIRQTIAGLVAVHPALAEHLDGAVRTGRFFSYRPPTPISWRV